jgi:hypothetical protein
VAPVDGQDVRDVGRVDRPHMAFGHPRSEGVHTDRHAHPSDLSDVSLLDQVTYIAGETALQADDVSDAFRRSQRQEFLRFGGAGRKQPLAVEVLSSFDGCSGEPGLFRVRGEDRHKVHIGIGDEVVKVVELCGISTSAARLSAVFFVRLDTATTSKSSRVLRAGMWPYLAQPPAPMMPTRILLLLMICPCVSGVHACY